MSRVTIRLKRDGPYLIALEECDRVRIVDADDRELVPPPERSIALCRCGGSSTKPFCDGTHKRNGFCGTSGHPDVSGSPRRDTDTR